MPKSLFFLIYFLLAVADAVRTSLGPRGMDKMVIFSLLKNSPQVFHFVKKQRHKEGYL